MLNIFTDLYKLTSHKKKKKVVVAAAHNIHVLEAITFAYTTNLADAILIGNAK